VEHGQVQTRVQQFVRGEAVAVGARARRCFLRRSQVVLDEEVAAVDERLLDVGKAVDRAVVADGDDRVALGRERVGGNVGLDGVDALRDAALAGVLAGDAQSLAR